MRESISEQRPACLRSRSGSSVLWRCWRLLTLLCVVGLAACGRPFPPGTGGTGDIRHLFDKASRSSGRGTPSVVRRTAELLAADYLPGSPVQGLIDFVKGTGGECAPEDQPTAALDRMHCTFENVNYDVYQCCFGDLVFLETTYLWELHVIGRDGLIERVRVEVNDRMQEVTQDVYTVERLRQIREAFEANEQQ